MPIENLSDIRRLPRLGMIKLGIKKEGQHGPYPAAVDYFVCPPEVQAVYGEKPTVLDVMLPSDDYELVAPQYYRCYSYTHGLICKGDGKHCKRKVDTETGDFANRETKEWALAESNCEPAHCPMIGDKQCKRAMTLVLLLPEVPGLGIYHLNTSSFYSIVNINSQLAQDGYLRRFTHGRIAFLPLVLSIGPQVVTPVGVGRKTVYALSITAKLVLADLIRLSHKEPARVLLPVVEEEEPPEDQYPEEVLAQAEEVVEGVEGEAAQRTPHDAAQSAPQDESQAALHAEGTAAEAAPAPSEKQEAKKAPRRHRAPAPGPKIEVGDSPPEKTADEVVEDDVPDINALFRVCNYLWKNKDGKPMQPVDVARDLGYGNTMDLYQAKQTPWQLFVTIRTTRTPKGAEAASQ